MKNESFILEIIEKVLLLSLLIVAISAFITAPLSNSVNLTTGMPNWNRLIGFIVGSVVVIIMTSIQAKTASQIDGGPGMVIGPMIAGCGIGGLTAISIYFTVQIIALF